MKTCLISSHLVIPAKKYYYYHGQVRSCNIEPTSESFICYDTSLKSQLLKVRSIYQCGEPGWSPNLYDKDDHMSCDPKEIKDDNTFTWLYSKTVWGAGAGLALYYKETFLQKLKQKVVAIDNVTVYMIGLVKVWVPGTHFSCGPNKGKLYVVCTHTTEGYQGICMEPFYAKKYSFKYGKCKPAFIPEHNWDMKTLEEDCKIGFRVDQCTEDDPLNYGYNKTYCYYNYCVVDYREPIISTYDIQDPVWDIGTNYAFLYGSIVNGAPGYFIFGIQLWKKISPEIITEKSSTGNVNLPLSRIIKYFSGLDPVTDYQYRAFLRNTGTAADTIFGSTKDFTTK